MCVCIHRYVCVCICVFVRLCVCVRAFIDVYVCICVCVCMYVCVFVHASMEVCMSFYVCVCVLWSLATDVLPVIYVQNVLLTVIKDQVNQNQWQIKQRRTKDAV